jgi:DNA-binding beta-propeller fold protein YncE
MRGSNNSEFQFPYFLARDENTKTLYIADYGNERIMSYASGASAGTVAAGGNGFGTSNIQLESPVGLYFDSLTNSLLIGNSAADNIVRWVLGGNNWTPVAGMNGTQGNSSTLLQLPMGVILDPMGNMYVADAFNHRIQFFLAGQTTGTTIAGITNSPALNDIQLNRPYSIRLDNQLNLYVVDLGNHRVQKFLRY